MNKSVLVLVLLLLSLNVLAQTPQNQSTLPPQTTSVQALLEKISQLGDKIDENSKQNQEMRTQFDAKLERIRQSDQLFYLMFNFGTICLFVVLNAVYQRAMFSRNQKKFISTWASVGEQVNSMNRTLASLTSTVDVLVRRISAITPPEKPSVAGEKVRKPLPWKNIILFFIIWICLMGLVYLLGLYLGWF